MFKNKQGDMKILLPRTFEANYDFIFFDWDIAFLALMAA
jgi:hypothetical protein